MEAQDMQQEATDDSIALQQLKGKGKGKTAKKELPIPPSLQANPEKYKLLEEFMLVRGTLNETRKGKAS